MSIKVSGVSKIYGSQKALDNVTFEVKPGEIVGFLGPNGAGKSTMMKIICGYIPQNNGKVEVCGMNVEESEMEIKKRLGYLPENNPLYYEMYVREYLNFIAGMFGMKDATERVEEIIELVGLSKESHKKIGSLSKGYKQRVGLAQAFIHDPEVLILDEPTTGLDPNQIVEIRQLIKKIGANKTVMLSTHIMQEVEAICDRAIIINEGQIVADQDVKSLKNSAKGNGELIVEFSSEVEADNFDGLDYESIGGMKYRFKGTDISALRKNIMQKCLEKDIEIVSMTEGASNLEEVFRQLTSGAVKEG